MVIMPTSSHHSACIGQRGRCGSYDNFGRLEGVGGINPGGLPLRFNGLDAPSVHVGEAIVVVEQVAIRRSTGPGERRALVETGCSSSVICGSSKMLGRASASSVSTNISFRSVLVFLRILFGVRAFGFLSVSFPLSTT